jgi:hypothetical protein
VNEKAQELIERTQTPKEAAIRIFSFARDGIPYCADFVDAKGSHALGRDVRLYMSKAKLQIALLCAVAIPARYHRADVEKDAPKDLVLNIAYRDFSDTVWANRWCECYLSQRWLSCEAVFDEALYQGAIAKGLYTGEQIPTIDWIAAVT